MNQIQHPEDTGVYLMKNREGDVLYVGKAKNLKNRIKQYYTLTDTRPMIPVLMEQVDLIETLIVPSEKDALLLENTLIKKHKPKYNVLLKDDKTFISLMINHKHRWPRLKLVRYKGGPKEDGLYFGPYTNAHAARQTFELLTKLFPLRQCSDAELKRRTRPCLLYGIKRCIAPCVNLCTKEEYDTFVQSTIAFLKGQDKEILKKLKIEMQEASDALEFEKADALLKTIQQLEHVTQKKSLLSSTSKDTDAIGIYRHAEDVFLMQLFFREGKLIGSEHYNFSQVVEEEEELLESFLMQHYKDKTDPPQEILLPFPLSSAISEVLNISLIVPKIGDKKALVEMATKNAKATFLQEKDQSDLRDKLLLDLSETLHLSRFPKRIECFDTSNISGSDLVACMVAFTEGIKDKKRTRLYHIRDIHKGDDYAALHQVLSRRLIRAKDDDDLPDLIIVDGGKGQLNVALDVFKELDIASVDLIAVAKEKGRHDKGMTEERIFLPHTQEPLLLSARSPLLFLLQQIRDEAHRKAISFHKTKRKKRLISSELEQISGIGPTKRKRLLTHFGSLEQIKKATVEELKAIKGLTKKDIEHLKKINLN